MKDSDWHGLHLGATIHLRGGNFYVRTLQILDTKARRIGEVWDRNGKRITQDSFVVYTDNMPWGIPPYTPRPGVLPVINDRVVYPGSPDWPEVTRYLFRGDRGEHNYSQEALDVI